MNRLFQSQVSLSVLEKSGISDEWNDLVKSFPNEVDERNWPHTQWEYLTPHHHRKVIQIQRSQVVSQISEKVLSGKIDQYTNKTKLLLEKQLGSKDREKVAALISELIFNSNKKDQFLRLLKKYLPFPLPRSFLQLIFFLRSGKSKNDFEKLVSKTDSWLRTCKKSNPAFLIKMTENIFNKTAPEDVRELILDSYNKTEVYGRFACMISTTLCHVFPDAEASRSVRCSMFENLSPFFPKLRELQRFGSIGSSLLKKTSPDLHLHLQSLCDADISIEQLVRRWTDVYFVGFLNNQASSQILGYSMLFGWNFLVPCVASVMLLMTDTLSDTKTMEEIDFICKKGVEHLDIEDILMQQPVLEFLKEAAVTW